MSLALVEPPRAESDLLSPLLDGLERFCRAEIRALEIDRQAWIPNGVLEGLAELGLFGVPLPAEHGGAGLPLTDACRLIAALARHDRSVATTVGLHLGLGTRGLVAYGSEELKSRYLPRLAAGKAIAAFATTEPGAGSDLSALATTAFAEGAALKVNGQKIYVTNGGLAQVFTLTVSTPGLGGAQRGTSLVLFERGDHGLTVGPEEKKLGLKGSSTTSLHLDEVRVPAERVVGEAGRGSEQLHHVLAWGRTLMSAGCCGTARLALDRAVEHTATRRQFGKPLNAQQVVQEQLALAAARLFAMEALVQDTASLEQQLPALLARSLSAKVFSSVGAGRVTDVALQLHGGSGFIEETGLALLTRDARITRIFEGANDVLLTQIGAQESVAPTARTPLRPAAPPPAAALATRADLVADQVKQFRSALDERYRVGVLREKRLLHRLGAAVMWREALDAAVRRAFTSSSRGLTLAALFADQARREVEALAAEPADFSLVTQAMRTLESGDTW